VGGPQLASARVIVDAAAGVPALPTDITARSWLVADLDSGQVLAARDPHSRHLPASTLKTLTALALLPLIPAHQQVPFTARELALTAQPDGRSTRVGLQPGQSYPAQQLFGAMIVLSANDAAEALAGAAPGGRAAALQAMNDTARTLQANDTFAGTPDGLDAPGQTTSAYDLALLARAALRRSDFRRYDSMTKVGVTAAGTTVGGLTHNRLLASYPGAYAGKDGYTSKAGQVWWGAAARGGRHLVVVVVDAGQRPVTQEIGLLDWGFQADGKATPVGELVGPASTDAARPANHGATSGRVAAAAAGAPSRASGAGLIDRNLPAIAIGGAALLTLFWQRRRVSSRRRRRRLPMR
jgi:D-alanyl-D-alanine carboxypeptidase (penicillin-binding protein 5/6)